MRGFVNDGAEWPQQKTLKPSSKDIKKAHAHRPHKTLEKDTLHP